MYRCLVDLTWDRQAPPAPTIRTSLIWDEATGRVREVAPPLGEADWLIDIEWEVVDEVALPVALAARSALPGHTVRSQWLNPTPKAVTREVFARLPVGEIVRRARKLLPPLAGVPVFTELALAASQSTGRKDWLYREVARAYLQAQSDPRSLPGELALATWEILKAHPDPRLYSDDRVRVRKWIARARKLGYLPPAC